MPPEITTVGKLLNVLKSGEMHGIVQVGASSKNVATRNWKAFLALRQRANGHLTAEILKQWICEILDADDSNVSYAGVLSQDLRGFNDALDDVTSKGKGRVRQSAAGRATEPAAEFESEATKPARSAFNPLAILLSVFTDGVSDERIAEAASVVGDTGLTANEKLTKIDKLIRIPANASGEQLGDMVGVSKTAVQKTQWYRDNRKGERNSELGRRREAHQDRGKRYERDRPTDEE